MVNNIFLQNNNKNLNNNNSTNIFSKLDGTLRSSVGSAVYICCVTFQDGGWLYNFIRRPYLKVLKLTILNKYVFGTMDPKVTECGPYTRKCLSLHITLFIINLFFQAKLYHGNMN